MTELVDNLPQDFNYEASFEELEDIRHELENNEVSIDELAKKVKRAKQLLHWCRLRLQKTGGEIDELLED